MSALATRPVSLEQLVEWYRGTPDDREIDQWDVPPVYSAKLAEAICQRLHPVSRIALVRYVLADGSEMPINRHDVDAKAWDELVVGFERWQAAGRPRL